MNKQIQTKVELLKELTNKQNLQVDYNPHYGGYRLVTVNPTNGGHSGAFGKSSCCERQSCKVFNTYLDGLISGLSYKIDNQ